MSNRTPAAPLVKRRARIERWYVHRNPFQPPEMGAQICGYAYGMAGHADGTTITTSRIASVDESARTVTTENGSIYTLGEVEPAYAEFCAENGYAGTFPTVRSATP